MFSNLNIADPNFKAAPDFGGEFGSASLSHEFRNIHIVWVASKVGPVSVIKQREDLLYLPEEGKILVERSEIDLFLYLGDKYNRHEYLREYAHKFLINEVGSLDLSTKGGGRYYREEGENRFRLFDKSQDYGEIKDGLELIILRKLNELAA